MSVDDGHPGRAALSRDKQSRERMRLANAARKIARVTSLRVNRFRDCRTVGSGIGSGIVGACF
jgi:hypothetical protein